MVTKSAETEVTKETILNTNTDNDQTKAVFQEWRRLNNDKGENIENPLIDASVVTPWDVVTNINKVALNRVLNYNLPSIKSEGNAELVEEPFEIAIKAGCLKSVGIPKHATNGRSKIEVHPDISRKGVLMAIAGNRKKPCIHIFKDGQEKISADGIASCGKARHWVSSAYTTWDNDVSGEQLLAWQQERRANRKAA